MHKKSEKLLKRKLKIIINIRELNRIIIINFYTLSL